MHINLCIFCVSFKVLALKHIFRFCRYLYIRFSKRSRPSILFFFQVMQCSIPGDFFALPLILAVFTVRAQPFHKQLQENAISAAKKGTRLRAATTTGNKVRKEAATAVFFLAVHYRLRGTLNMAAVSLEKQEPCRSFRKLIRKHLMKTNKTSNIH